MAYATKAEIESEFKNITFAAGKNITDTDVDAFIVEADALINTLVGARYTVPVDSSTSPNAFSLLKLCSRTLVAGRVRAITAVKQASNQDANFEGRGSVGFSSSDAMRLLNSVRDGKTTLPDATLLQAAGGFSSYNVDNDICPVMKKDETQW